MHNRLRLRLPTLLVLALLVGLMVFQGGFFQEITVGALIAYCVGWVACLSFFALTAGRERNHRSRPAFSSSVSNLAKICFRYKIPLCAFVIALLFALSVVIHGLPVRFLIFSSAWALSGLVGIACIRLNGTDRDRLLKGIAWLGVISSILGAAMYVGLLPIGGTMHVGRLQFFFQYANAAGAWFAVASLLCLGSEDRKLKEVVFFPLTALLFTQSMGSLLIFALIAALSIFIPLIKVVWKKQKGSADNLYLDIDRFLVQGMLAAITFISLKTNLALGVLVYLVASFLVTKAWPRAAAMLKRRRRERTAFLWLMISGMGIVGLLFFVNLQRVSRASATIVERLVQDMDAVLLLGQNLPFGIGPDQWQYQYLTVRSAEYQSAVVHNSYLQLGLDAGLIAMVLFLVMVIYSIYSAVGNGQRMVWPPLLFMALHFLVDFDLRYSFFVVLVFILMCLAPQRRSGGICMKHLYHSDRFDSASIRQSDMHA